MLAHLYKYGVFSFTCGKVCHATRKRTKIGNHCSQNHRISAQHMTCIKESTGKCNNMRAQGGEHEGSQKVGDG